MVRFAVFVALLLSFAVMSPAALAQDASPEASPMAMTCDAPELPPGTPTPMEDVPPASEDEEPPAPDASPVDEDAPPATDEGAAEDEAPAGNPASDEEAADAGAAVLNLFACLNAGDFLGAAALMTDNFIQNFIGVPTPYDVQASIEEDLQPIEVISTGNAMVYEDGSISIDVVTAGFFSGPGGLSSSRWTFVDQDGLWKLDNFMDVPLPEGALPDAVVIDVQMVDYAFALSEYTVPANTPVIFRTTNHTHLDSGHVNVIVTYPEGTTAEQVIEGEVDIESSTGFFGAVFLEPGMTGDLAFTGLEPGTYFLICDVPTEDGTPHFEIGMVTTITVE
jgi:uncharacterized cupredoxin-like copper-binding protein